MSAAFSIENWGRTRYAEAWERQRQYHEGILAGDRTPTLVLTEHHPVLTLGANFHPENLLHSAEDLAAQGIELIRTDRGGDVTYHGPGQLVVYPLFPLDWVNRDIHRWLRELEQVAIDTAAEFGVIARRFPPNTGAWIGDEKYAAIGVKVRRWVSLHGLAINCETNLNHFAAIVPCGIRDFGVANLSEKAGRAISIKDAEAVVTDCFRRSFASRIVKVV